MAANGQKRTLVLVLYSTTVRSSDMSGVGGRLPLLDFYCVPSADCASPLYFRVNTDLHVIILGRRSQYARISW